MFTLQYVGDDGRKLDFVVEEVDALGFSALRDCMRGGNPGHPTAMHGYLAEENPSIRRTFKATVTFSSRTPFYALVPGGALPPPYLSGRTFLLDRNIVASLKQAGLPGHKDAASKRWAFAFLNNGPNKVNPLLGAFEGAHRRTPTFNEFCLDVAETERAVMAGLPSLPVVPFSSTGLRKMYELRRQFDQREASEMQFLKAVAPLLAKTVSSRLLEATEQNVVVAARSHGLRPTPVVLAAIAKLYESHDDGHPPPAGQVLHLAAPYSDENAYNALADLRQIELLAASQGHDRSVALLTGDKGLALLWCGLGIQFDAFRNGRPDFRVDADPELFPRLPEGRWANLYKSLTGPP